MILLLLLFHFKSVLNDTKSLFFSATTYSNNDNNYIISVIKCLLLYGCRFL